MKRILLLIVATILCTVTISAQSLLKEPTSNAEPYNEEIIDVSFQTELIQQFAALSDDERASKIDMFLTQNRKYLPKNKIDNIRENLMSLDDIRLKTILAGAEDDFKNPTTVLVVSIVVPVLTGGLVSGIDRMMIGQTGWGILKLLTYGGLWIWNIIDWFCIEDLTRKYNYNQLMELCGARY